MSSPASAGDSEVPGLQRERTSLAWQRASLAFLGLGLLVPRFAWPSIGAWAVIPAVAIIAGAVAIFLGAEFRYRHNRSAVGGAHPADGRLPLLTALVALAVGLVGLGAAVLPR